MKNTPKKIVIVGSGIAGLTSAWLLGHHYEVTLLEAGDRLGGHTATQQVKYAGQEYTVDTGFIVFNDRAYPNFIKLLRQLNVASQVTEMGFSVAEPVSGFEYALKNFSAFFSQRKNLLNFSHWRLLRNIVRFNRSASADYLAGNLPAEQTLEEYLIHGSYSPEFIQYYLLALGTAIWSSSVAEVRKFSVLFVVRFLCLHGLLGVKKSPQWRVIRGGSKSYIAPMLAGFGGRLVLNAQIHEVRRTANGVSLLVDDDKGVRQQLDFDQIIFACHCDHALAMLADATEAETAILGAIGWRNSSVVLHHDATLLPHSRRAWSSWNLRLRAGDDQLPLLTYNLNILQGLDAPIEFCVTLNDAGTINPDLVFQRFEYAHPIFSPATLKAQNRWQEINGIHNTWFAGAYWFNGFHEDGVVSAIRVCERLGVKFE